MKNTISEWERMISDRQEQIKSMKNMVKIMEKSIKQMEEFQAEDRAHLEEMKKKPDDPVPAAV